MREDCILLARRSAVNPCNVEGRLLNAYVEGHSPDPTRADARKAAVLEHIKRLRREADRQQKARLLQEHCRKQLQLTVAQQQALSREEQQRTLKIACRRRLADYIKTVTVRNAALPRTAHILTFKGTAAKPAVPRLARSSTRRTGQLASAHQTRTHAVPLDNSMMLHSKRRQDLVEDCRTSAEAQELRMERMCISMRSTLLPRPAPAPQPAAWRPHLPQRRLAQTQLPLRQCNRLSLTGSEARRLKSSSARLANVAWKVKELRVSLPQLCMCHQLSPLNPEYPFHCASNCPLSRNPEAHELMLRSLLQAYEVA